MVLPSGTREEGNSSRCVTNNTVHPTEQVGRSHHTGGGVAVTARVPQGSTGRRFVRMHLPVPP
jgi:hypothetical protein